VAKAEVSQASGAATTLIGRRLLIRRFLQIVLKNKLTSSKVMFCRRTRNDHNWQDLAPYLADGHVNYFGHRYATVHHIAQDVENDRRQYPSSQATYYPDTFTHEISNEYSPHWNGPMLYDSINVYSVVTERNGRVHRALTRLTVCYTLNNEALGIYALRGLQTGNTLANAIKPILLAPRQRSGGPLSKRTTCTKSP
jgi:hypothetical protein